jgi:peptidoglycan L-alanyl-D-glutamate endopeptidase CwlK
MPSFSRKSIEFLEECDPRIQLVFLRVIEHYDCTIYEGRRGEDKQQEYYSRGLSKVEWPDSKHNTRPLSMAVHAAPWIRGIGIDWEDEEKHRYFAHFVLGVAAVSGVNMIWGGDWDGDWDTKDQKFHDLDHFELVD